MVESVSAGRIVAEDSGLVVLELPGHFDSDRNGVLGEGGAYTLNIDGFKFGVALDSVSISGLLALAALIDSLVGVVCLSSELVFQDVVIGVRHESSIASHVSIGSRTVNELLLRKRRKSSSFEEDGGFERASGGKSPTRSASLLVFDVSDSSLFSPVDWVNVFHGSAGGLLEVGVRNGLGEVGLLELFPSEVGELVDSKFEGMVLGIVLVDQFEVVLEDRQSVLKFQRGNLLSVELLSEFQEGLLHSLVFQGGIRGVVVLECEENGCHGK